MNRKQRRAADKLGHTPGHPGASAAAGITELLRTGIQHHQAGRLAEAETCYRRVLQADPRHAHALYMLGVVAQQVGQAELAVDLIGQAIKRDRQNPVYHLTRATALEDLDRLHEALEGYDKALALKPDYAEAFYSRGIALKKIGHLGDALANFEKALELKDDFAEAHNNRAVALLELSRFDEAVVSFDRALALRADYVEALHNRGIALQGLNRIDEALADYDRALAIYPDFAEALYHRGSALQALERFDEALACYDKALTIKPDCTEALDHRGDLFLELNRIEEALACYSKAVEIRPDSITSLDNCGRALLLARQPDKALAVYDRLLAVKPDHANAFHNRGVALREMRRVDEALASFEQAATLLPDQRVKSLADIVLCANDLCAWDRTAELAREVVERVARQDDVTVSPFILLNCSDDPKLQRQCAEHLFSSWKRPDPMWTGGKWQNGKIRIAYLSADFHNHATAHLTAELFERHDRTCFEVIAISFGVDDGSDIRKRLAAGFDRFIDVRRMSDAAVARLVHEHQVDIAIDLKGHTKDWRPGILAHRPAPIQVGYLGYPGTMGAPFIDYIVADNIVAPFEHQAFYSERIVHLPDSYQVNDRKRLVAASPSRAQAGLPERGFVFCCFNQSYKIKPEVFDVWMRLLHAVGDSVLWLYNDNEATARNLRKEAAKRGVDPDRLVFAGPLPTEDHLARCRLADLFLDTLPINAHTTASDALWVGLPVITQLGNAFAGRVAASLLHAIGLPELVTHSIEEYEKLALCLATTPALLQGYRDRLVANRLTHPLFDTDSFRRHIETAYLTMWEIWQRGDLARSFAVAAHDTAPARAAAKLTGHDGHVPA